MSDSIVIKEDGVEKTLIVDKLRLKSEGAKTNDWKDADDIKVSSLSVWRNGTYSPEDFGIYGFDAVDVNINNRGGDGAELTGEIHEGKPTKHDAIIQEGGKPVIMSGVERIAANKTGGGLAEFIDTDDSTVELNAKENRTYTASRDGKYAYSSANVNVPSGGGGDDPYAPENLPNEIIASLLDIVYEDGEAIDYSGLTVRAYIKTDNPYGGVDRKLWKSNEYPNGEIPVSELSLPVKTAEYEDVWDKISPFGQGPWPSHVNYTSGLLTWSGNYGDNVIECDGGFIALMVNPATMLRDNTIICSSTPTVARIGWQIGTPYPIWEQRTVTDQYTYDGKTVYYNGTDMGGLEVTDASGGVNYPVEGTSQSREQAAWTILYGLKQDFIMDIPVSWRRAGDGALLQTETQVFVTAST